MHKPTIDDAPGLRFELRRGGTWHARWIARRSIVARGYRPRQQPLWHGREDQLDAPTRAYIAHECQRLEHEMNVFAQKLEPEIPQGMEVPEFTGRLDSLIRIYLRDPDSPFQNLRYRTRIETDRRLNRLIREVGNRSVAQLTFRDFKRWHEAWRWPEGKPTPQNSAVPDHVNMAYALMRLLRMVFRFGVRAKIGRPYMQEISTIISEMSFPVGRSRTEVLTAEHANAIRRAAHEAGKPSIALAQALQFELTMRQKDVIGEWVPLAEHGLSPHADESGKWLYGLTWHEIDDRMILRHRLSKSIRGAEGILLGQGTVKEYDLTAYPMVVEELAKIPAEQRSGALVKEERTGLPYRHASRFRYVWREIARKAGVPDSVKNMDSRAGGATETVEAAGGNLDLARHHLGHKDVKMTARYVRDEVEKTRQGAVLRAEFRRKEK